MIGCLYKLEKDSEVKAYPNLERLKKKYPNVIIIKEIPDINTIDQELIKYNGGTIKEKPKQDGLRECPFKYRVNTNTVLMAYTQKDLDKLKKSWNI